MNLITDTISHLPEQLVPPCINECLTIDCPTNYWNTGRLEKEIWDDLESDGKTNYQSVPEDGTGQMV